MSPFKILKLVQENGDETLRAIARELVGDCAWQRHHRLVINVK